MKHVPACLSAWKGLTKPFQPTRRWCEARAGLFKYSKKQFSPLAMSSEARTSQFMHQERARKQFFRLWSPVKLVQACLCAVTTW